MIMMIMVDDNDDNDDGDDDDDDDFITGNLERPTHCCCIDGRASFTCDRISPLYTVYCRDWRLRG